MKKLRKLSLLNNDQLAKIKGGVIEGPGGISLFGNDLNSERKCYCDGTGVNDNQAGLCRCSDAQCGGGSGGSY